MGKLKRNGDQWEGSAGASNVTMSNETMQGLVQQQIAREEAVFGELSEEELAAVRERMLNVDTYAKPTPSVSVTRAIKDASPPMRLWSAKD